MKQNLSKLDRSFRFLGALALFATAAFAPLPWALAPAALIASGVYLLVTTFWGTCLGYRLMGLSSCPLQGQR
jgi:Protein of unknown function (DUF2892)